MLLQLPIVLAVVLPGAPAGNNVPKIDIVRECQAEVDTKDAQQRCVDDEKQTLKQLRSEWPQFNANDRRRCYQETTMGGTGSYAEFATCLEMARDTRKAQQSAQKSQK